MVRHVWACVLVAGLFGHLPCRGAEFTSDPREKLRQLIEQAEAVYAKVQDYTATFTKQERIGGALHEPSTFFMKFRKPFNVYLIWPKDAPNAGMEAIYVRGENNDKILIHAAGLADVVIPTIEIEVSSEAALQNNRHPITHLGIGYFLDRLSIDFNRADQNDEISVYYRGVRKIESRRYHEVEVFLEPHRGNPGYYCYHSVIYFDVENKLPTRMLFYNWENDLIESYAYTDVTLNPGLTDLDFDPKNKDYNFGLFPLRLLKQEEAVPVRRVMPGCDYYTRVAARESREILPFIRIMVLRPFYLGYKEGSPGPQVIATEARTRSWFNDLRLLVGMRYDGKDFRITDVVVLNEAAIIWYERRLLQNDCFVKQFHNKSAADDFKVGKDIDAVTGATSSVAGATRGITEAVEAIKRGFDNMQLRDAGEAAPKIYFEPRASAKEQARQ